VGLGVSSSPRFQKGTKDVHVTKVEEADMPKVDGFGMQHLLGAHGKRDTRYQLSE
jgi:hypothetical protein